MPDITSSMKEDKKGPKNREFTLGLGYSKNTVRINLEVNNHFRYVLGSYTFSFHIFTSLLSNTHKIVIHWTQRPLLARVFSVCVFFLFCFFFFVNKSTFRYIVLFGYCMDLFSFVSGLNFLYENTSAEYKIEKRTILKGQKC